MAENDGEMTSEEMGCKQPHDTHIFFDRSKFDDENYPTSTSIAQDIVETSIKDLLFKYTEDMRTLKKSLHVDYLMGVLKNVSCTFEQMDSSRSWIIYWVLHSLALLKSDITLSMKYAVINFFRSCQRKDGGFGGGPMQEPHLATTYAAVMALCTLGIQEAYEVINRKGLLNFLQKMKVHDGSFYIQEDGEIDVRGIYCAVSIYNLLKLKDYQLFENSIPWITRCQTYEGGFAGNPGMEAHGGYTFCSVASLYLLGGLNKCDVKSLKRWLLNRQTSFEGGFQGRTNKLVDSCYSFWQYACLVILKQSILDGNNSEQQNYPYNKLIDNKALQNYILICCQNVNGGFIDKPTKRPDAYHTCYSLSGLSLAQTDAESDTQEKPMDDKLPEIHPVYNILMERFVQADSYFSEL
ncbi:hypothetical protein O3M35_011698 [Rhynocoris fuscipes]|uniref:Protein farnesyltransferase subunit beta n=1 Tax=Rhynocoris fuscipes TaxID=488301 RepID=A0AAW1CYH9_9HEMI